ncbi:MAG: CRISPR-associated endonuclease Cas1, partial [Candidatus Methylomirabilis sp.]|nr:CRISPR-associated endonuclease Cas1 [Deltaproteobacteria bacterium]
MKRLLNTLYVTTQGAYVGREGEALEVRVEEAPTASFPILALGGVVCFGRVSVSPSAMGLCAERGVGVSFLSMNGRFLARVQGPVSGNVLLPREQYRRADDPEASAEIARACVVGKIANGRAVLLRAARDRPEAPEAGALGDAAARMASVIRTLRRPQSLDA